MIASSLVIRPRFVLGRSFDVLISFLDESKQP